MTNAEFFTMMQNMSQILGQASRARSEGLVNEANLTNQANQGATSRYQALVNANRLQNIEMPNANLDQGTRGSVLSTWQPVRVGQTSVPYGVPTNGPVRPTITGGPSITPELRQLGDQTMRDALARQLAGNPISAGPSTFPGNEALGLTEMPKGSWVDSLLGYGGLGASILGTLGQSGLLGGGSAGAGAGAGSTSSIPASFGNPGPYNPASTPTTATTPTTTTPEVPFGGGGGSGPGASRSQYQDMLTRQQLANFGMLFDYPNVNQSGLGMTPDDWRAAGAPPKGLLTRRGW